jgi:hypothetical protein
MLASCLVAINASAKVDMRTKQQRAHVGHRREKVHAVVSKESALHDGDCFNLPGWVLACGPVLY